MPEYDHLRFTVLREDPPVLECLTSEGSVIQDRIKNLFEGSRQGHSLRNILPFSGNDASTIVERLKTWHRVGPDAEKICEAFRNSVKTLCSSELWNTTLGIVLRAIREVSNGLVGRPAARLLISVEDDRCLVPWEVLIHHRCSDSEIAPVVFRQAESAQPVRIEDCRAYIGCFCTQEHDEYPDCNCQRDMLELAYQAVKDPDLSGYVESLAGLSANQVKQRIGGPGEQMQYLFVRAKSTGEAIITRQYDMSPTEFRECATEASLCAVFPIAGSVTDEEGASLAHWLEFAQAAHGRCQPAILGIGTVVPLERECAATIAGCLTGALGDRNRVGKTAVAEPSVLAETVTDKLRTRVAYPSLLEFLLLVGNPQKPIESPPEPESSVIDGRALAKQIRKAIDEDDLDRAINFVAKWPAFEQKASLFKREMASSRRLKEIGLYTPEEYDRNRARIGDRVLMLAEDMEQE